MKKLIVVLLLNIAVLYANAQFLHIEAINVPSYVNEGTPVNMEFKVKNTGSSSYNGTMMLYMAEQFFDFPKDIYTDSVFIQANDSVQINTNATFQNFFFQYGNNIVVVWPKGINVPNDSVSFPLFMDVSLMVDEYTSDKFYIYPNPVVNEFNIYYSNTINSVEQVRIFDQLGREVVSEKFMGNAINLSNQKSGLYIVEIVLSNRQSIFSKIHKL
jgi:hypothetical protein